MNYSILISNINEDLSLLIAQSYIILCMVMQPHQLGMSCTPWGSYRGHKREEIGQVWPSGGAGLVTLGYTLFKPPSHA